MKLDKLLEALNCAGINQENIEVESINDSERFYTTIKYIKQVVGKLPMCDVGRKENEYE